MAERRVQMAQNRLKAQRARHDTRDWVVNRRERTRKLIERLYTACSLRLPASYGTSNVNAPSFCGGGVAGDLSPLK